MEKKTFIRADIERWQKSDFVIGYEIHLSNNQNEFCSICNRLAGKYPKSFMWDGWHDKCKCFVTAILQDDETFSTHELYNLRAALNGHPIKTFKDENEIRYVPEQFIEWFLTNRHRFNQTNTMPEYATNNMQLIISSYEYYKNQSR